MLIVLSSVKDGLMNPIRNTIGYVLVPVQSGVNRIGYAIYEQLADHRSLEEIRKENDTLKDKVDFLTEENNILEQNSAELDRLRSLYQLDQDYLNYQKVGARIIAKDSENWFQVFRINKGSQDGIRVDQNVIANGGLVGIVTDVGLNYATVRSIIDDESRVSAMGIQSSDTCIVAGDLTLFQEGRLRITDMKKDAVIQDGDRIVTSNISSKFVPGILIGYAVDVHDDEKHLMKNGYLIPAADFDDMSEVLVITEVKADSFKDTNDGSDVAVSDGTAAASAPAVETSGEGAAAEESETAAPAESSPAASSLVESLSQSYQGAQASQDTETQGEAGGLTPEQISEYERTHPETEEDTAASGNGTASGEGSQ
jgi:rod shape-determining protein MreC